MGKKTESPEMGSDEKKKVVQPESMKKLHEMRKALQSMGTVHATQANIIEYLLGIAKQAYTDGEGVFDGKALLLDIDEHITRKMKGEKAPPGINL